MDRDFFHKDQDGWIDSYLKDELSETESDMFEKHLLSCSSCRKEVSERDRIINLIQSYSATKVFQRKKKGSSQKLSRVLGYVAAASVCLVVAIFLFTGRDGSSGSSQSEFLELSEDSIHPDHVLKDEIAAVTETGKENRRPDLSDGKVLQREFPVHPIYESLIGTGMRSLKLEMESPRDSVVCAPGSSIEFLFSSAESDSLNLAVMNVQGDVIWENKIASPYQLQISFPVGLYYWQLTDNEEALHTAKIYVWSRPN